MHHLTSQMILYSDLPSDSILSCLSGIFAQWENHSLPEEELVAGIYAQTKRLLDLSTTLGFDRNLWQCYLAYVLVSHPNSFSLTCEQQGATAGGTINAIATHEMDLFLRLFHFDFSAIEADLGIRCFSLVTSYHAIPKNELVYHRAVSEKILALAESIASADGAPQVLALLSEYFRVYGMGDFGLYRAFRVAEEENKLRLLPINNLDSVVLDDLIGYETQKAQLRENMDAFVSGYPFNNTLLYGDAGTGKSTSVKAVLNEYWPRGLRVIELYKHQFHLLSPLISMIKARRYRFVIFIDDLSFDEGEVEYKYLKAVIEGGLETRPENIMICATSNRRHLIKEPWKDRSDMEHDGDIHRSDTMEEKLSLSERFGCAIRYDTPDRRLFNEMVTTIALRTSGIHMSEEELLLLANKWELRHGGVSGRCAQQFINYIAGKSLSEQNG